MYSLLQSSKTLTYWSGTNQKWQIPNFSKNYSSNYVAHRTSQFSITWEYQNTEFGKCDLPSSIDTNRSSLKQSTAEHFLSLDSTLNPKLTVGFCTL